MKYFIINKKIKGKDGGMDRNAQYETFILNLLRDKEYFPFAYLISLMEKNLNSSVSTAAIWFNKQNNRYCLELSDWFWELPFNQQAGVVKHECLHMIMQHFSRFNFSSKTPEEKKLMNIATDMAINQYIKKENLPNFAIYPESYGFPKNLTAEQYLELLKKKQGETKQNCNYKELDDHEFMAEQAQENQDDLSGTGKEMAETVVKSLIESMKSNVGKLPIDIEMIIDKYKTKRQINWKKELRKYLSKKSVKKIPTIKKRNRRFPERLEIRGKKATYESSVAVIVDVSGSMSDKEIMDGLKEIDNICKLQNSKLNIVQVDSRARSVEPYSPNMDFKRKGRGGTKLYPGVEQFEKEKVHFDILVVISDMQLFDYDIEKFSSLKKPQIWLTQFENNIFNNSKHINSYILKGTDEI